MSFRRKSSKNQRNYAVVQENEHLNECNNLYDSVPVVDMADVGDNNNCNHELLLERKERDREAKRQAALARNYRRKKKVKRAAVVTAEASCILACGIAGGPLGAVAAGILVFALEDDRRRSKEAKRTLIQLPSSDDSCVTTTSTSGTTVVVAASASSRPQPPCNSNHNNKCPYPPSVQYSAPSTNP